MLWRSTPSRKGIDYPLLIGEQGGLEAVTAFGMETVLPFQRLRRPRTAASSTLKVGELHADEAHLILERLQRARPGQLTLAAAREQIARRNLAA